MEKEYRGAIMNQQTRRQNMSIVHQFEGNQIMLQIFLEEGGDQILWIYSGETPFASFRQTLKIPASINATIKMIVDGTPGIRVYW